MGGSVVKVFSVDGNRSIRVISRLNVVFIYKILCIVCELVIECNFMVVVFFMRFNI